MIRFRRLALIASASALALSLATAVRAEGEVAVGPYLAARVASGHNDYSAAASYYTRALARDPSNPLLLESAILSQVGLGDIARAVPVAEVLRAGGRDSQVADLVLLVDLAKRGEFDAALARLDAGTTVGPLVEGLFRAWAELGRGQMSEAQTAFDAVVQVRGLELFGTYHKALALASAGDFEGADKILSGAAAGPLRLTRRGVIAHVEVLSQLERNAAAIELIDKAFGNEPDPTLEAMRRRLEAGEMLPFTVVTSATDGMAEVFHSLAGALSGEATDVFTLVYARLGEYLRPDHVDAILLVAALLESQDQYDLATVSYNRIPRDDPAYPVAELGRAEALIAAGRMDAAIEALQQLAKSYPDQEVIWANLGDVLRRAERFEDAVRAYDAAIALFGEENSAQWPVYYARGTCHERQKRYETSEADMRKALDLQPGQPQILNYLGYSFLEQGRNFDEALAMIESAVAARPEDGYIVDSLAWAYFRLGRYDEAVAPMERAVELMPVDAVVNDHLGDVYWAVGRKREAEFQWSRALSFAADSSEADADRIRRKLDVGLDAVLAAEGAKPLAVSKNAD
ncbi:tetratricopeptide repeat protein [Frigidibacter mobilis]|uniref:TPR repeat-containing protein n=1 Tax=Frigidibacter mobilis TaxID=1335048 RepID=A0A159YYC9_9RHOB|nr:tetratricopeptide repeat protein [Frigidibacter mobilis]AMY67415.1 TPR repeat-containing protein [Frigidibacter mobilis]